MDHTADVGIEVEAPDLPELFRRAAAGALWMALGDYAGACAVEGGTDERTVRLDADGPPALLRAWLREVLYWQEVEGFALSGVDFSELTGERLRAVATGISAPARPIREIKGVTWHGLRLDRAEDGSWAGRVIFDV